MNLKNKNVLLIGLAKTGIATVKRLYEMGANIIVNDIKKYDELENIINELKNYKVKYILGEHINDITDIHLTIISPGVPLDLEFIKKIKNSNVEVIGEVELSYRLSRGQFIGITGTNGKTTTTTLVGEIFKASKVDTYIVGNIGNPVIETVGKSNESSILVTELSSFQLESIKDFKPKVSAVLNITPDHLNRHKTMENYINAKARIFENQDKNDFTVLNYDCIETRKLSNRCNSKIIFFSLKEELSEGIYVKEDDIIIKFENLETILMKKEELGIPGSHNLENALASIAMCVAMNIELNIIKNVLKTFKGVEHRLEFVRELNGVMFVNDSKGTNPDASIKAIQSYNRPIILIAGGYDKKSDFTEFSREFNKRLKALILLGQTADEIEKSALNQGFNNNYKVKNMKEAVQKAYDLCEKEDVVLLSPACASWGMYENYEVRGNDFKNEVLSLS